MCKPSPVPILEDLFSFGGLMQKCNKESRLLPTYSILRGRLGDYVKTSRFLQKLIRDILFLTTTSKFAKCLKKKVLTELLSIDYCKMLKL